MLAASTAIVVVAAAADLGGRWWVKAVARHPFSIDDAIAPCVFTGRVAAISSWWVLHQVKVHQHPEGEATTPTSRHTIVELSFPA
jgi:hypothetical protein